MGKLEGYLDFLEFSKNQEDPLALDLEDIAGACVIVEFDSKPPTFAVVFENKMPPKKPPHWGYGFCFGGQEEFDKDILATAGREATEEIRPYKIDFKPDLVEERKGEYFRKIAELEERKSKLIREGKPGLKRILGLINWYRNEIEWMERSRAVKSYFQLEVKRSDFVAKFDIKADESVVPRKFVLFHKILSNDVQIEPPPIIDYEEGVDDPENEEICAVFKETADWIWYEIGKGSFFRNQARAWKKFWSVKKEKETGLYNLMSILDIV